mgnify:CR=1 FL=1
MMFSRRFEHSNPSVRVPKVRQIRDFPDFGRSGALSKSIRVNKSADTCSWLHFFQLVFGFFEPKVRNFAPISMFALHLTYFSQFIRNVQRLFSSFSKYQNLVLIKIAVYKNFSQQNYELLKIPMQKKFE